MKIAQRDSLKICGASAGSRKESRILIVGLGNLLLRDDGVGVHAIREMQKKPQLGILPVEIGTAVLDALHLFEWADRILAIDAMKAGGSAGTLYSLRVSDVEDHGPRGSLHQLNLLAALRLLRNARQPEIVILGVEPGIIDSGINLSPVVAAALPVVIHSVREVVEYWQGEPSRSNGTGCSDSPREIGETSASYSFPRPDFP
jgi:hydrogenase maturation protease